METMQAIQKRIESIRVTRQISQAMQLVSNAKIRRAMEQMEAARPFTAEIRKAVQHATGALFEEPSPYLRSAPVQRTLYIVIGSDRGLCGGYNINVGKHAMETLRAGEGEALVLAVGAKMRDWFTRRRVEIVQAFTGISQNPFYADAREIAALAEEQFLSGQVQRVVLVHTHFASILTHEPVADTLLPLQQAPPEAGSPAPLMRMEPGEAALLEQLVPEYLRASLYGALTEGAACEQSARITSMDAAVRNSTDIIDKLQLQYNQARQAAITQDLNEIVSGAEALR